MGSYISPFQNRYGACTMRAIFSDEHRHRIWRDLWYALALAENKLGVDIVTDDKVDEIKKAKYEPIDYNKVMKYESETHHDVVAHLKEFCDHCPTANSILHLGATSCYITDNADIIIMYDALATVLRDVDFVINILSKLAYTYKDTPLVGRTHLQKAQLTTVGKRVCMWINDFNIDRDMIYRVLKSLKLLGCKCATGSQSSLYTIFNGDYNKAEELDKFIGNYYGMDVMKISGQTYTRKYDSMIAGVLSQIAQSASKMATDIRLMSAFGEAFEGFDEKQVGSSAMPYKRNPITCEKICGISRYVICNSQNMAMTASTQWLERTLDDSSNKRIVIPELFLGISEILRCANIVARKMVINTDICVAHANEHSKMASLEDDIIIKVMNGCNRQDEHSNAIWSDGSDDAHINTGFASQQVINFLHNL